MSWFNCRTPCKSSRQLYVSLSSHDKKVGWFIDLYFRLCQSEKIFIGIHLKSVHHIVTKKDGP